MVSDLVGAASWSLTGRPVRGIGAASWSLTGRPVRGILVVRGIAARSLHLVFDLADQFSILVFDLGEDLNSTKALARHSSPICDAEETNA